MPSDERKQGRPYPATPGKHDTGRGIILRIIRGSTPVLGPDQHPVDSLMLWPAGHRTSPHRHGVVHVRSHWRRLLAVPRGGHHVGDQGCPGFSNGFTATVTMFTTIQGIGCGRNGRIAGMRWRRRLRTSRECVRKLEAGVYDLTVGTLQRLATALGVQ